MALDVTFPKNTEGFESDIALRGVFHLILQAFHTGAGPVWSVADVAAQRWLGEQVFAGDIEEAKTLAKAVAEAHARHLLNRANSKEKVPAVVWAQAMTTARDIEKARRVLAKV